MNYLENLFTNLSMQFGNVLPKVLGALLVLIIGFIIARIVRGVTRRLLGKTQFDENLGKRFKTSFRVDKFVANLLYYVVVIYTLLVVLNLLGVNSVLRPLENMVSQFVGFLPNAIAAGIIGFAGYVIANIASEASSFITERVEGYGTKAGVNWNGIDLSKIIKQVVFILIFIPILIIALDTLKLDAVSEPATDMLRKFLNAVPNIIAAGLLLFIFYFVGKYLISIGVNLLQSMGVDRLASDLNMDSVTGGRSLSQMLGNIGLFFIMFTATIAAVDKLHIPEVSTILHQIFDISGQIFFGLIILLGGVILSNFAIKMIDADNSKPWLSTVVRFAILGLFLAFGLHTMGIAPSIVNLAFGLILGAIAVAFALAFGLGGREAAGEEMKRFFDKMRK